MRTETVERTLFTFDELDERAREKACDWYRSCSQHDDWWDAVCEYARECARIIGIDIDQIYFSGFWSQGDGACFEGSYCYEKGAVRAIAAYTGGDSDLVGIAKALQAAQKPHFYRLAATCAPRGHYQHSGCMAVDVYHTEDRFRDIGGAESEITDALREFADWIYCQLEKEYDYLNSDEVVADNIRANEYEFTEDGECA